MQPRQARDVMHCNTKCNRRTVAAYVLLGFCVVCLGGCQGESAEAQIRAQIAAMELAVEARMPGEFVEYLSADFIGDPGAHDAEGIRTLLRAQLLGNSMLEITLGPLDVVVSGDRAQANFSALMLGGSWLPERGQRLKFETGWKLHDGQWRCYVARWERI